MHILSATPPPVTIPGFVPYQNNGGTIAAVTTKDGCIVFANDTRISGPEGIIARSYSKHCKLTDKCYMLASGMTADIEALARKMHQEIICYQFAHKSEPSLKSISQIMSLVLYSKRRFPYYAFAILAGIGANKKPEVYSYDAVGCVTKTTFAAQGTGAKMLEPALYRLVQDGRPVGGNDAISALHKLFHATAERDVCTGDMVEYCMINPEGQFQEVKHPLRID